MYGGVEMENGQYSEVFGRNLRHFREELKLTRIAFSSQFCVNANTLQGYESGKKMPGFKQFVTVCNSLRKPPNYLLDGLYPWKTELDALNELRSLIEGIDRRDRHRLTGLLEIVTRSLLKTPPKLDGVSFGTRLQYLRLDAEMEAPTLADRCSIAVPTLLGYESGQYYPGIPIVLKLCEIYGVSPSYLMAPVLTAPVYEDMHMASLRPRQIHMILEVARYYTRSLST